MTEGRAREPGTGRSGALLESRAAQLKGPPTSPRESWRPVQGPAVLPGEQASCAPGELASRINLVSCMLATRLPTPLPAGVTGPSKSRPRSRLFPHAGDLTTDCLGAGNGLPRQPADRFDVAIMGHYCIMKSAGTSSTMEAVGRLLDLHHRPVEADEAPASSLSCSTCNQKWPCDTEVVATALLRATPGGPTDRRGSRTTE